MVFAAYVIWYLLFGQSHFNSYELLFKTIYDILVKTIRKTEILK